MKKVTLKLTYDDAQFLINVLRPWHHKNGKTEIQIMVSALSVEIAIIIKRKLFFAYDGKKSFTFSVTQGIALRIIIGSNDFREFSPLQLATAYPIYETLDKSIIAC